MVDLSNFSLYAATPEQTIESRRRQFVEWGRWMNEELYRNHREEMDTMVHACNGKLRTWVLAFRNDPTSLEFKCSCETYQRTGVMKVAGSSVESVPCYVVTTVFAAPEYRGQGFGKHMMRLVHWIMAPPAVLATDFPAQWGDPPPVIAGMQNARFSVLYSDVGPEFYLGCGPTPDSQDGGWVEILNGSMSTTWDVQDATQCLVLPANDEHKWVMLDKATLEQVFDKDVELIRKEMLERSSSCGAALTFLPNQGVAAFQSHFSHYYLIGGETPPMTNFGVALSDLTGVNASAFASWTVDIGDPNLTTLIITRLRCSAELFPGLFDAVLNTARTLGMTRIEAWNLPNYLDEISESVGGKTIERKEHLSSLKIYGGTGQVEWIHNEKFCWL